MSERSADRQARADDRRPSLGCVSVGLLLAVGLLGVLRDPWEVGLPMLLTTTVMPLALALWLAARSAGGRRRRSVGIGLTALALWWVVAFGWWLDGSTSPVSVEKVAVALSEAAAYEFGLALNLWPLLLVAGLITALVARRRGRQIGGALSSFAFALLLLSFPANSSWYDGCNVHFGPAPLVTFPAAQTLAARGIGVLPHAEVTQAGCAYGDLDWKPFWRGTDDIPPAPVILKRVADDILPVHRIRQIPKALPGRRLDRVAFVAWPERDELTAIIVTKRRLVEDPTGAWPLLRFEIDGVVLDDPGTFGVHGSRGWCYSAVWVRNPRIPRHDAGDELTVDLMYHGYRLASGRGRVQVLTTDGANRRSGERFGCPPWW